MTKAKHKEDELPEKIVGHRMELASTPPTPGQVISMEKEDLVPDEVEVVEAPDAPQVFGFTTYRKKAKRIEGQDADEISPFVYFVANQ